MTKDGRSVGWMEGGDLLATTLLRLGQAFFLFLSLDRFLLLLDTSISFLFLFTNFKDTLFVVFVLCLIYTCIYCR
jgi:hypothetical protein